MNVLELFDEIPDRCPLAELEDIWNFLAPVLVHFRAVNTDEEAIQRIQHGTLRDRALLSPSIYGPGADLCTASYYLPHVFAFLFEREEGNYVWLTTQLDRCFGFGVLLLPCLNLVIALYPFSVNEHLVGRLEAAMVKTRRDNPDTSLPYARPTVVTGYFHIMHVLWNELPALDRALGHGQLEDCVVAHVHQPLGPLEEIFPELRGRLRPAPADDNALNTSARLLVGLGGRTIPPSTQARIVMTARRLASPHLLSEIQRFKGDHWPIFWISVKPPNRSFIKQDEILGRLIHALKEAYPKAGILINGVCFPWDLAINDNYGSWFRDLLKKASVNSSSIIADLYSHLDVRTRSSTRIVTDLNVLDEVCWSGIADFYFCHGGSMQNKIGWIHDVGGVTHSNASFIASLRYTVPPTSARAANFFLPSDLVSDDDPSRYSSMELARKDQNYSIVDVDAAAAFVIDCFETSDRE